MLTTESPFQEYVSAVFARMQQIAGFSDESECNGVVWGRAQGDILLGEGIDRMAVADEQDFGSGLKMGQVQVCRDFMDPDVRRRMIALLAGEPLAAAFVYRSGMRDDAMHGSPLAEDERRQLLSYFHSAYQPDGRSILPVAEKEIEADAAMGLTYPVLLPDGR